MSNKPTLLWHQEHFKIFGYRPPLYFWFLISGFTCDCIQAMLDYMISIILISLFGEDTGDINSVSKDDSGGSSYATICWTVSYILSIAVRHTSHRYIVFGEYEGSYWASLFRLYGAYSASIILSMCSNYFLSRILKFSHKQAWITTMIWTGLLNYFIVKKSWRPANKNQQIQSNKNKEEIELSPLLKSDNV